MSETKSNMTELGSSAPDFKLLNTFDGSMTSLDECKSEIATVIMFICNHCPYVLHINDELVKVANEYMAKGISFVGISANDVENYPQDSPELMTKQAQEVGYKFPYLYDETQDVAKAYGAACTPDFFIYDKDLNLAYRGRFDGSTPGNGAPLTGEELRGALDALVEGKPVSTEQNYSLGCNIKWK
ncbi:MAG TPA: thioredoxin family protein [Acidimicrobiia bacterium]|nr:thioredoxin family protein [Acidimicrobiia bacterium]